MNASYRFVVEGRPEVEKGSLFIPAESLPIPRSLISPDSYRPPATSPGPAVVKRPPAGDPVLEGLRGELRARANVMRELQGRLFHARPQPFKRWRVDTITLTALRITWLDERNPTAGNSQRFFAGRRAVTIVNQDTVNPVWIRHTDQSVITGGWIAPGGAISIPLAPEARIFGQAAAVTSNISFYQYGD